MDASLRWNDTSFSFIQIRLPALGVLHRIGAYSNRERLVLTIGTPAEQTDITALSFEAALRELEGIVKRMETGEAELEQAIADYARGMALKGHCERKLAHARMKVEKIVQGEEGKAATVPFDPEAS